MSGESVKVFFSYCHKDEELRDELAKHLRILERQGVIASWHDRMILPGEEWNHEINSYLNTADIILLLISSDFIASDYCWDTEVTRAMERHESGDACVIPLILRDVDLTGSPFAKLQALPKNAQPVTTWTTLDAAFKDVTQGIRVIAKRLIQKRLQKLQRKNNLDSTSKLSSSQISETQKLFDQREQIDMKKASLEAQRNISRLRLERIQQEIYPLEEQIQFDLKPNLRKALDWLSNREIIAKKASDYVFKNCSSLEEIFSIGDPEEASQDFCWNLEKYLELIYFSLLTESHDLLEEPVITPSLLLRNAYELAFTFIEQRIPKSIDDEVSREIKICLEYLINRIFD